jgi:hypothetical protein
LSLNLFGQSNSYYWHKGEKIPLTIEKHKKFVLYENQQAENAILYFEDNNWKIVKKDRDNSVDRVVPHNNGIRNEMLYWSVLEKDRDGFTDSQIQQLSNQVLYVSPFFRTQNGEEVGLSHIFYVKLKKAEDIEILEEFEKENNVEIIGNNKFMPMWYTLVCTKNSKGNALQMANLFYESGQFSSAEPDLMADNLIQCTDDDYSPDQWNLTLLPWICTTIFQSGWYRFPCFARSLPSHGRLNGF